MRGLVIGTFFIIGTIATISLSFHSSPECRMLTELISNLKTDSHMCVYTCTGGYLAPPQIPYPTQRAIVVSYDNELNMPSSGMCENGAVAAQKCPLSHSLKEPAAPFPTWLAYKWLRGCVRGQRLAGELKRPPWPPPKTYRGHMQRRWRRDPTSLKVNCGWVAVILEIEISQWAAAASTVLVGRAPRWRIQVGAGGALLATN